MARWLKQDGSPSCPDNCLVAAAAADRLVAKTTTAARLMADCVSADAGRAASLATPLLPARGSSPVSGAIAPAPAPETRGRRWNYGLLRVPAFSSPDGLTRSGVQHFGTRGRPRLFSLQAPVEIQNLEAHKVCVEAMIAQCPSLLLLHSFSPGLDRWRE